MENTQTDGGAAPRDAMIYVPGLSAYGEDPVRVDGMARRLAAALNRHAGTRAARYSITEGQVIEYSDGLPSRKVTIRREDQEQTPRALVDVFEFEYRDSIRERYEQGTPLRQAVAIAWLMLLHVPNFFGFLRRKGKGAGDKLQIMIAAAALLTMTLYLGILIFTAIGTGVKEGVEAFGAGAGAPEVTPVATSVVEENASQGAAEAASSKAEVPADPDSTSARWLRRVPGYDRLFPAFQSLIVMLTGLGLLTKGNLKQFIKNFSLEYAGMMNYVSSTRERNEITGRFADLLEKVHESDTVYRHVDIVGYSFGSVVAIDTIFRTARPVGSLDKLHSLVTVASPFDMVRSFWPRYFEGRDMPDDPPRWLNVYSLEDILSSNFRDDEEIEEAAVGVTDKKGTTLEPTTNIIFGPAVPGQKSMPWVRLARIRELHTAYWGKSPRATTFMADVVPELYGSDGVFLA